jgi:MFS family permease
MYNSATSKRLLYLLFITQSLFSASQIAVFTLLAIVATRLSGSESLSGMPSSALIFAQAFAALPMALVMGRFGRRLGLTLGYLLAALGGLAGVIAILYETFPLLVLSAALFGIGRGSGEQSRFVAGEMFPEAERARMIGRIVFAGTIGAVTGPALVGPSGRLLLGYGFNADLGPWLAAFVLCTLAALLTLFLLRPDPSQIAQIIDQDEADAHRDEPERLARPLRVLLGLPMVQLAILATLISQTVMVVLMVMTPLHMDHHHHSRDNISLVISAHTLGMFGLSALTGYLIDRLGRIPMLVAGGVVLIASALLAPVSTNEFILAAALFLLGLGWNFGFVAGTSLLADSLYGKERTRVQGLNDSLVFFVAGLGSLSAGPLFASGGYVAVSTAGVVLTCVMIALTFWLARPRLKVSAA